MATKPSIVPTWNTGGANNTAPTSPKIVLGFTNGERAASSYFNNRLKLLGEWCQYLSDGALTGAHTFGSTVGVTGAVTCSSTLGVTGAVTLSSTLAVTGLITATAGVTAAANQHVTVSGTGRMKHGNIEFPLPASAFVPAAPASSIANGTVPELNAFVWYWIAGTAALVAPVLQPVGMRIRSATFTLSRGGTTIVIALKKRIGTGGSTTIASSTISTGSGTAQYPISSIDYTMEADARVWWEVSTSATGSAEFEGGYYVADHP